MLLSENIMIMTAPTAGYTHKVTADEAHRKTRASKRNALMLAFAKTRSLPGRILNLSTKRHKTNYYGEVMSVRMFNPHTKPQDFDEMWYWDLR
jgi:hypothetical protein